jgi:hypothetical protein
MRRRDIAVATLAAMAVLSIPAPAAAAGSPPAELPSATSSPCPRTLKFAGSLYLDTDTRVPVSEVGPQLGETEPNPARCALPDRLKVYRHNGHNSTEEVVYYVDPTTAAVFRSAGATGFPGAGVVRWLVLALVVGIIGFAALPAILGHLRQPPVEVGRSDADWIDDA